MIASYAADLVLIELGVNSARTSTPVETYQSELLTIATAALTSGADVILLDLFPDNSVSSANQTPYNTAAAAVAATLSIPVMKLAKNGVRNSA